MNAFQKIMIVMLVTACSSGCAMTKSETSGKWNPLQRLVSNKSDAGNKDDGTGEPVSMAVVWKSSVYERPGTPSVRGFGGRVFFYDANSQPVAAQGELVVYGYTESETKPPGAPDEDDDNGADKKFVFPADKFQSHFSQSDLGASYSVWIPWEKAGGYRKSITLIPVFKTAKGQLLRCGHSIDVLPGKKPDARGQVADSTLNKNPAITPGKNVIAQASFQSNGSESAVSTVGTDAAGSTNQSTGKQQRVRTTTFSVPPSLARRMAQLPGSNAVRGRTANATQPKSSTTGSSNMLTPIVDQQSDSKQKDLPAEDSPATARIFGMPGSR